jgi:hypothetical protein
MSRLLQRGFLKADLAAATDLLSSLQGDLYVLDRMGLESRIRDIQSELEALGGEKSQTGEAILVFYGAPVAEEHGIDARFSAEVLGSYQDLISRQVAAIQSPHSGRSRKKEARLHITNVVHGSFGFVLEEMAAPDPPAGSTPLAQAIESVTQLFQAVQESEEVFADVAASTDGKVYDGFRDFLSVVHKAGAAFRVTSDSREVTFDGQQVALASERASARRSEIADQPIPGTFLGALLDSRRFEHRSAETGEVLRGKVAKEVEVKDLLEWVDKPCTAHMRVVILAHGSREIRRYTLSRLSV